MTLRRAARCAVLAGLLTLALVPPCAAQRPQAPGGLKQLPLRLEAIPYGQRTDAFRRLLFEFRFQPVTTFAEMQEKPDESILIVFGDPNCLTKQRFRDYFPDGPRSFIQAGGAVLIATDKEVEGEARENLWDIARVSVTGETFKCSEGTEVYRRLDYCPFVEPIADSGLMDRLAKVMGMGDKPALFRNPHPNQPDLRVATNAPSSLRESPGWWGLPSGIHRLARLPAACLSDRGTPQREGPLFAVGGSLGQGRVLVLADHSIFINRMILPRDTGNLEFAANCLHWLRGGASTPVEMLHAVKSPQALPRLTGQRNKVLFVEDGQVHDSFAVPMKTVPIKPPPASEPAIVAAVDRTLANMEDRHFFDEGLLNKLGDHGWTTRNLGRSAVWLFSLTLLLFLGYRYVWRGRHQLDTAVPLLEQAVAEHEPTASLLAQRRRALLRAGNVWETAHQLARQCFESAGVALTGPSRPRLAVQGNWWQRWRVRRRVARLWQLAHGETPVRISPAALKRWVRELDELKTALAKGTIRLT